MAFPDCEFMHHCCDLLTSIGPCVARRMFGGWGISTEGLTVAIIASLGSEQRLWLKADDSTRACYEAAGCDRFTYMALGQPKSMNYYSAPDDAMESPALMQPWAMLALECAVRARTPKAARKASAAAKRRG